MRIQSMFREDINRKINGVVQVDQDESAVLIQELSEYVVTRELKKHFITFFNMYNESFRENTADIGVWISGFFGSGKSHFLKMLSYLLENKEVQGERTVERFRQKFSDDPATFMLIDSATRNETDTILFNIDIEGSINKDKTAVLRVFAKMFYNYLGFYGENLKVAKLEQFITKQGKWDVFCRVFEEKNGGSWIESRDAYAFFEDDIAETLQEVLGMSETAARNWFNGSETVETSIAQLVSEIKEYVDSKPDTFRLLFMVDEVGQYVGGDTNLLLNLQSLVEKIGSECNGKVWVICTGQEAIDEIIRARENEFSRIQARFKTRLSLSSSSADEVIQKRILLKTDEAASELEKVYNQNDSVLRNLFSFSDAILDIKGYSGPGEFAKNFPFVPYQFILIQKIYTEIRKHGNSGKHMSGGERSMISGFQEAAQRIEGKDEFALAPLYLFYDTVHTFLDSSIRRVIERCDRAAMEGNGIQPQDVNVLKLLYLVRYVDDVKANLDNIVILMADDIRVDKITMRERVRNSLNRLLSQNYIGRAGDTYNFLTDEEQDIQREIKNTNVATADIVERLSQMIFADIYTTKKFRYGRYNFAFDHMVDSQVVGNLTGGMMLRVLTVATDSTEKQELQLTAESDGQAIVNLAENRYYESLESAMKIRKYVKGKNVAQLPKSVQDIIQAQQNEASKYEANALEELKKAFVGAQFYVAGEHIEIKGGDAKSKIDQALEYLVAHVYSCLDLVGEFTSSDAEIVSILQGDQQAIQGQIPNQGAVTQVEKYLEIQHNQKLPTTMSDVQSRFQKKPYGWLEIDIAALVARLIHDQKVTIRYGGATIQPSDPRLPDLLRKRSEIGKTSISTRVAVSAQKVRAAREMLREFFNAMDVPQDEDGLMRFIVSRFGDLRDHYKSLSERYNSGRNYPDKGKVQQGIQLVEDVLSQQKDNTALIDRLLKQEDALFDSKDDLQNVESFFKNQVQVFDAAVKLEEDLRNELEYLSREPEANDALNKIRMMVYVKGGFDYKKVPELNVLMETVKQGHHRLLADKRSEVGDIVTQCMGAIHAASDGNFKVADAVDKADAYYAEKRKQIRTYESLALLDGLIPGMLQYKDSTVERIEVMLAPPPPEPHGHSGSDGGEKAAPPKPKKVIRPYNRQVLFPAKRLESEADIDNYVEKIRNQLKQLLKNCDGIQLK